MALPISPDSVRVRPTQLNITSRALRVVASGFDIVAREIHGAASRLSTITDDSDLDEVDYISAEEGREMLERAAQRHLGMTAGEFMKRWDNGEYADVDEPAVMRVAMLLPLGR